MTPEERRYLQERLVTLAKMQDAVVDMLLSLENENPGLSTNRMYLRVLDSTRDSVDHAKGLADYIGVATDENWKQAK